MQWRCTAYIIVNSKHTSVSVCVCLFALCIYVHIHHALSTCPVATILNCTDNQYIFYSQARKYNTNGFSAELFLSSYLSRPPFVLTLKWNVFCVHAANVNANQYSHTFASMHTFMHGMRHWLKQCKSNRIATIVHATNDAMRCCWTVLNRILRNNECSECRAGQNICFGAVEFEIGNESNVSVRERLYVWMRVVFSFSILNVHWD